ncbi:MAG: type II toxin-antitoxin system RelE/ParE family toxin [Snowella sp.]|jgi:mRNA interferase RelE/StbE|nr:type II toxin-antitoxin system RelE/ParE family toxin [Snowella sp.]PZV25660.1 MAG: type II toxin-antitoxin system RelE/ParE family toxin [Snowella sp.]
MNYHVNLSLEAEKVDRKANSALIKKLDRCFEQLEINPYSHPNIKVLKGNYHGCYRYRVEDYRVVYSVNESTILVNVIVIAHRSKVYE